MEVLGIDFGTSNTVAVLAGPGRAPRVVSIDGNSWMPSAVYVDEGGTLIAGREAQRQARLAPERFEPNPKRRVDDGEVLLGVRVVAVVDAIAAVLRRVGEETRRQLGGRNPDQVHLTHPAAWGSTRQNVLLAAARAAGLGPSITLLPEPVAAAAHFASLPGHALPPGAALAVYDLGGGTFDCAVVGSSVSGYTVLAEAGLPDVGGVDFDQTVLDHLGRTAAAVDPGRWQALTGPRTAGDRRAARSLREDVRAAKETLSRYSQADLPLPEPFEDSLLTRREFEGLVRPAIVRTVETLAGTLERAGTAARQLAGVYLVGGSSRIPLVATVISEKLGVIATTMDQPETAVAMGAAISAGGRQAPGRTQSLASGPAPAVPAPRPSTLRPATPVSPGMPSPMPPGGSSAARPLPPSGGIVTGGRAAAPNPSASGPHGASVSGPLGPSVSGPLGPSVSGPHGASVSGPQGASVSGPLGIPVTAGGSVTRHRGRVLALGVAAAVVIAAAVVVIVLTTRGSGTAGGGGDGTSTGGSAVATGSASVASSSDATTPPPTAPQIPSTCGTSPVDTGGMTPCLLALAGPNADLAMGCKPVGADDANLQGVFGKAKLVAASACAGLDGGGVDVVYVQLDEAGAVPAAMDLLASTMSTTRKDWRSGTGSGAYVAAVGHDGPEIYWSYESLPVIAYATTSSTLTGGKPAPTAQELGSYWQKSLLPQPTG